MTSLASSLPYWKITDLGEGKIGIQCPRNDCQGKAVVNKKKWVGKIITYGFIGRPCTYCFKTARVPDAIAN